MREVVRPSLGTFFPAAVCVWLVTLACEQVSWQLLQARGEEEEGDGVVFLVLVLLVLLVGIAIFIITKKLGKRRGHDRGSSGRFALLLPVGAIICAALCSALYWASWASSADAVKAALAQGDVTLDVISDATQRDYGVTSQVRLVREGRDISLRVTWPDSQEAPTLGHRVCARGSFLAASSGESGHWNHRSGYAGMLTVTSFSVTGASPSMAGVLASFRDASFARIAQLPADSAGIMAGILLGNRSIYAGTQVEQDFKTTGLAHLMAVSGTHLAVVCALAASLLNRIHLPRSLRLGLLISVLVAYLVLTGASLSALRSCVMCALGLIASLAGRRKDAFTSLSLCVIIFICLEPSCAFSTGFLLSVLAVFGLFVFSPLITVWILVITRGRFEKAASATAATLGANLTTLAVTVPLFKQLPLIAPLSSMLAAPLITAALMVGIPALLLCAIVEPLGFLLLKIDASICAFAVWLVARLAAFPLACLPAAATALPLCLIFIALMVFLWVRWPLPGEQVHHGRVIAAFLLPLLVLIAIAFGGIRGCTSLLLPLSSNAQLVMLDVGQGDSFLIRDGTASVLIDTGEDEEVLLEQLARQGISHLDAVLITHKDVDHAGALAALDGVVEVAHVYIHEDLLDFDEERDVLEDAERVTRGRGAEGVCPGDSFAVGRFTLTVIAPQDGGSSENDDSLICLLEYDDDEDGAAESRALLCGDAEEHALEKIYKQVGDIDVLKVPHHGSKGGVSQTQLALLRPELALISVGADNSYGHPSEEMLDRLEAVGAQVYRSDLDGCVAVSFADERIGVAAG